MEKIIQRRSQKWFSMRLAHMSSFSSPRESNWGDWAYSPEFRNTFTCQLTHFYYFSLSPSLGQSKGVLFWFALLSFLLLVVAMKRKCGSNLKIIWILFSESNTRTKILSQSRLHTQQLPGILANTVDFRALFQAY